MKEKYNPEKYNPEKYWSEVGDRIEKRDNGENVIAGDDEPYYRYKRSVFISLLNDINFKDKSVLEIGCGPGGNLLEILKHKPKKLIGVDISEQMVKLAKDKLPKHIEILKIDGVTLPFQDREFDKVITATVLQHNTNEKMLISLMSELSRVSDKKVYLFERVENEIKGDVLCLGRPIEYYDSIMKLHGFRLKSKKFINVRTSYYLNGIIRKGLNSKYRKEGEPLNRLSIILQNICLPITSRLDKIFRSKKDICRIEFERTN